MNIEDYIEFEQPDGTIALVAKDDILYVYETKGVGDWNSSIILRDKTCLNSRELYITIFNKIFNG